ncbi:protein phosphatase 2C domain-containing protein [Streptomyces sp. NPDC006283]|uniref:protein phosphatase 2C domain-containing protein n=1 Tax=Streptomyces sp. NPDC006283 TaxID=3156741 RepID=UPI0033AEB1F4
MSEQGERPNRPTTEDEWWNRLYDDSAPDTGRPATSSADTLDDRFDSASDTVTARPHNWWDPPPSPPAGGDGARPSASIPPRPTAEPAGPGPVPPSPQGGAAVSPPPPVGAARTGDGAPGADGATPAKAAGRDPRTEATSGSDGSAASPGGPRPAGNGRSGGGVRPVPGPDAPDAPSPGGAWGGDASGTGQQAAPPGLTAGGRSGGDGGAQQGNGARAPGGRAVVPAQGPRAGVVGGGPPTYDAEPTALPAAEAHALDELVADTVLDGARYGTYTLRAASVRGDSARFRGEPRRDALLTARFGAGPAALVLVAVAGGVRGADTAHLAAGDACRWIGGAVGRSHARLSEDIRAGRRGDLKSGLHRLTDRSFGRLRARAAELGLEPEQYTAGLRCLLLSADPKCRTRVFFGVGGGGLLRLRDGVWQDLEPVVPDSADVTGAPVVGFGSPVPEAGPDGDRLTMDLGIPTPLAPYIEAPPPPAEPFRFRASVARPGDTLLLCSSGLAEPVRGEPALAKELAERWSRPDAPGMAEFLADTQLRVKGYADDRTAVAVWEA